MASAGMVHRLCKDHCVEHLVLTSNGEATFWDGIQLNMNFNASIHTDNGDVPGMPCVVLGLEIEGATLPQQEDQPQLHFDVDLQPGVIAMFFLDAIKKSCLIQFQISAMKVAAT